MTIQSFPLNTYHGYTRYDFQVGENAVIVVEPKQPVAGRRWIWRAEFFDAFPALDLAMLERGWWVAYMNVGNTFGCPSAMRRFDAFYDEMTAKYGFHRKPVLEGLSRGGLYVYNWAADNTDKVGLIVADNPVCDFKSWPGGKGKGPGSSSDWAALLKCYAFVSEAEALAWPRNPVDNVAPLVKARIPLVHLFGDADEVVPWEENTGIMAKRVTALGGSINMIRKPGCKHHPHGPDDPAALSDWILQNAIEYTNNPTRTHNIMSKIQAPSPFGPCPTSRQLAWQRLGMYNFIHFTVNTFTGREWGDGTESPDVFNPTELDCDQWCALLSETGFKGVIITAKHHDGFCLWPSKFTTHSVASSTWRDGKGDVVGELAKSARKYGLKLGIYISPWDRHEPCYGSDAYNDHFKKQLREVLTNYGGKELFEVWFDGACGEGPNGKKQVYDWDGYIAIIREVAPNAVIFSDAGPDVRWVGNEHGEAGSTCWSKINRRDFAPGHADTAILNQGLVDGADWLPPEVDVSIRPGWFHHPHEDDQVHSLKRMLDIWYHSVGRSACLNLNLPPDRRGLIHEKDATRLRELKLVLDRTFAEDFIAGCSATASNVRGGDETFSPTHLTDGDRKTYWATDDGITTAEAIVELEQTRTVNVVSLKEHTELGERIAAFEIEWRDASGRWNPLASGTTVSFSRILRTPAVETNALRLKITDALACPCVESFSAYDQPPLLFAPKISRDMQGRITLSAEEGCDIRYTLDGSVPTVASRVYVQPLDLPHSGEIRAVAVSKTGAANAFPEIKTNPESALRFGVAREKWSVIHADSEFDENNRKENVIREDNKLWQSADTPYPHELVIDMGAVLDIKGFIFTPPTAAERNPGPIARYRFLVGDTAEAVNRVVAEGAFDNIVNNPLPQTIRLDSPARARFFRFVAVEPAKSTQLASMKRLDVID